MTNYFPNHQLETSKKKRCYETHKDLEIMTPEGKTYTITGGSCAFPFEGYDIYVGFDSNMDISKLHYPWNKGYELLFLIKDQGIPDDGAEFKKLINWLEKKLIAGKSIHLGCIGGHGRTGLVLSALYTQMSKESDAIQYVRENYCNKAVETKQQVKFLMEHYNIEYAKARKVYTSISSDSVGKENKYNKDFGSNYGSKYFGSSFNY